MSLTHDVILCRRPAAAFAQIGVFWGAFAGLIPQVKAQVALSDSGFGLVMLVASMGAMLAMTAAPWVDRHLQVRALPVMAGLTAAMALLPGLSLMWYHFLISMVLVTMCVGTLDVLMNARVSEIEARVGRPLMNLNHAIFSFAYAIGALIAGAMREVGMGSFVILSTVAVIMVLLLPVTRGGDVGDISTDDARPVTGLKWSLILPAGLIVLVAFMSENATEAWSALHLERSMGAGALTGTLGPSILGLTMGIGRLAGQVVSQRWSEAVVIRWAALLTASGAFLGGWADHLALGYLGFGMLGLGVSVIGPLALAWVGRLVTAEHRTLAISRVAVLGYSGFFIGPPLMGFLSEGFGLAVSFSAIGFVLLLVPVVLVPLVQRRG